MRILLTIFSLLLITVAISGAENAKMTTLAPKNDATSKAAPAKDIATAKSIDGKEDEAKNMKKGDLGKDKIDPKTKIANNKNSSESEESPSEDAQEDLGLQENQGPTIPAYQIPEQPKDVKKKKRWVGEPNIDFAIDNALGALFGRPQPPPPHPPVDTVIEEVTYVDEYPPGPVVYKRSKSVAAPPVEKVEKISPAKEMDATIDNVDTVSVKGDPIAVSKSEVEAKSPVVSLKNEQKALPKMEFGDVVTILPAINEEKDFGSSVENAEEMKYQRIAPEVAGLIKKSVPSNVVEKTEAPKEATAESKDEEELQEKQMNEKSDTIEKKDEGQKEFVPVYPEEEEKPADDGAEEKTQKDDPKAFETKKEDESDAEKADLEITEDEKNSNSSFVLCDESSNDAEKPQKDDSKTSEMEKDGQSEAPGDDKEENTSVESSDKADNEKTEEESSDKSAENLDDVNKARVNESEAIPAEKARYREPEKLPINLKVDGTNKASEKMPLDKHEPKKLPEEEEDTASEESEDEQEDKEKEEKSADDEDADIEKDEYAPSDVKAEEDRAKIDAINPASPEIKKESSKETDKENGTKAEANEDDKLGPAAYPSELSDDFSVDHKTGLMPAVSTHNNDSDDKESDLPVAADDKTDDYNVLEKLQDDVDAASKKEEQQQNKENPDYIVVEELKDPIQGHRKYTILKPTYREFHPKENKLIEEVKATLDKSKVVKRNIKNFEENESPEEEEEESFESSFSRDTVVDDSNEILKNVADAIEQDSLRKPKKNQQAMFVPEGDALISLKKPGKPSLTQILGIPESAGPVMIEPEGGIPQGQKQLRSDSDEHSNQDYDAPQKVVIQSKQKITLVYDDDSSEELTKDSSSESSEEEESKEKKEWIPILDIAVVNDPTSKSSNPVVTETETSPDPLLPSALPMKQQHLTDEDQAVHEEQLKKYSNVLGNNLVITLSISPPILIIAGVICLILLLFKVYWILYSPPSQTSSVLPQHTPATKTSTKMDFRTPLSIITSEPKKQPI